MGMTIEEAKKLDYFSCLDCSTDEENKRSLSSSLVSPADEEKVKDISSFLAVKVYPNLELEYQA